MGRKANNFAGIVVFVFLLGFLVFPAQAQTESVSSETGPTLMMDYGAGKFKANSVTDFMYFVPLVSATPVDSKLSKNNTQTSAITSAKEEKKDSTFKGSYGFRMEGKGSLVGPRRHGAVGCSRRGAGLAEKESEADC